MEWLVVVSVCLVALIAALWGLKTMGQEIGRATGELRRRNKDVLRLRKALDVFSNKLGERTATGSELISRWRARLRYQRGGDDGS